MGVLLLLEQFELFGADLGQWLLRLIPVERNSALASPRALRARYVWQLLVRHLVRG